MIDREGLIRAYMMEYGVSKEEAESRADKVIEKVTSAESSQSEVDEDSDTEEEWDISEVICVNCKDRWIAVRPSSLMLKDIQCPRCNFTGAVIETGQEFYVEDLGLDGLDDNVDNES